jgi:hypothetical protein
MRVFDPAAEVRTDEVKYARVSHDTRGASWTQAHTTEALEHLLTVFEEDAGPQEVRRLISQATKAAARMSRAQ